MRRASFVSRSINHAAGFARAVLFAAAFSLLPAFPAYAERPLLDPEEYVLEVSEDGYTGYCYDLNGQPLTGWIQDEDENYYYYKRGIRDAGWDKIHGEWYYFDPATGILATNTTVLNYEVDEEGRMIRIRRW